MSTRSFIGKKIGNKVKYFFCHWDGYVDDKTGVGFTLNKYYNDERTVDELFDSVGGHIESLEKTPEETVADLQKVAKEYPRFGKELEEDQQKIANFYTYLRMCGVEDTEWTYLYDDGEWYYTSFEMEGFHSLRDTMTDYGRYAIYEDDDKLNFSPGDEDAARDYCHGLEGRSARVVDTKTGKQICATIKWFREHDDDMKENFHRRCRMLKESFGFDWEHGNFDVYDLIKFLEKRTGVAFKKYNTTTDRNNEGAFERFFETTVPDVGDVTITRYEDENDSVLEVCVDGEYVDGIDPTGDEDADPHFEEERNEFLERLVNLLQGKTF